MKNPAATFPQANLLEDFQLEHRELDETITTPSLNEKLSYFALQRIKKRKLLVKDKMTALRVK